MSSQIIDPDPGRVLGRRGLLRGGALVVGAAAGAVAVAAGTGVAHADDGDGLVLGETNDAQSPTTLRIDGDAGGPDPALVLANADGPALRLDPLSPAWTGELAVGDLAGTDLGPIVGVDVPGGVATTPLVTFADLASVPTPFCSAQAARVLDLRTAAGRVSIVRRSSADALTSAGKLRAGRWIDVGVVETGEDYELQAVFANLAVVGPVGSGHLTAYPPGVRPATSNLNFANGQTVANFALVGVGTVQGFHVLRLSANRDTWIILDVAGGINLGTNQPLAKVRANRIRGGRRAIAAKLQAALRRVGR